EDVRRDHIALVFADVGQRPDAVDVTDRPDSFAGAHVLVNPDPAVVRLDTDTLEADPLDAWASTGRHEQPVAAHVPLAVDLQDVLVTVPPRRGGLHPKHQLDSISAQ